MRGFVASGAWICHTGKVRKVNEDACLFGGSFGGASTSAPMKAALKKPLWVIALADGIGGHRAGAGRAPGGHRAGSGREPWTFNTL